MKLLGNILWFLFGGGLPLALAWLGVGVVMALTVVGFPFAVAAWRIAGFAAFPFGRDLVDARTLGGTRIPFTGLANVLWIVLAGLWLTLAHLILGVAYCITIIGLPFGLAHIKLAGISFAPLGKRVVVT